jgi:hypothetical protein
LRNEDNYFDESIRNYQGTIGDEPIEIQRFVANSTIIMVESVLSNSISAIYLDGHDSDDSIS